jgi:ATP-dependent 26S proteasome regulatory subunit
MICETVCKLHQITYFHCTTNSLLLKYADKCDSIIKCLFDTAKLCKPSVVFFDGIDTLNPVKNVNSYTYAAYHRAKDALYKQIDQTQYVSPLITMF